MKVLFIGNSLTQGSIGVNFVELLKNEKPDWTVKNAGVNGDTLKNIHDRVVSEFMRSLNYDYVVIEAGHNDIILPLFKSKGILFHLSLKHLLKKGRKPLEFLSFKTEYANMVELIQSKTNAKVILTTMSCIGENLDSEPNKQREKFNDSIREISIKYNCILADIGKNFNDALKNKSSSNYLLKNYFNSVYFDRKRCKGSIEADELSQKRNLILTIDGVHLNTKGASIYYKTIKDKVASRVGKGNFTPNLSQNRT